ncbi:hypothetical protein SCUCBS95973_005541 [Sporothrix curviconia]|uniref:AB hydrolase-1 domain-containing protein n=1 Tax=Sporothrix curviconia TaxID=1260050 RepID=A0ABP0BXV2_9PEZI
MKFFSTLSTLSLVGSFAAAAAAVNTTDPMYQLSTDTDYHFEVLRVLAMAPFGGSDIGETLVAAKQLVPGNFTSYYNAFYDLATRVQAEADAIDRARYPVSARYAYFRAASYYRSADFYLHGNWSDPRINSLWAAQRAAFDTGLSLLPIPGVRLAVPTDDGFTVEAIWYSSGFAGPRPTVIMGTGYDGCQEELYHGWVLGALERGYNVLTYEGPGQATVRREQNLGFVPNWEAVISPLVDVLMGTYAVKTNVSNSTVTRLTPADIDLAQYVQPDAIGLLGISFGGCLAPRAAAVEHRLVAVMAVDGILTPGQTILDEMPSTLINLFDAGNQTYFDALIEEALNSTLLTTGERWGIQQGEWAFNTHSAFDWLHQLQDYNMTTLAANISTPTFVADAENDIFFPGQGRLLADLLRPGLATYHFFSGASGAGAHCSLGAQLLENEVVFGWFDEVVANATSSA